MDQMKLKMKKQVLTSLLLATAAVSASAADEVGPYGFLSGGLASWSADQTSDDTGFGFKAGLGYRVNRYFAVEGGYAYLGKTDLDFGGTAKSSGFILDAVGHYPLSSNVDAIGRLGLYSGNNKATGIESKTKMTVKVGLGAEYKLQSNMSLRGEWEHYSAKYPGETAKIDMFTVGLNYAF